MPSVLNVYDHFRKPLKEIDAPTTPRSWVLNGYGKAEFSVGLPYLTEKFGSLAEMQLQYNNLVYIEHVPTQDAAGNVNGKLPAWVGIILPDRTWNFQVLGVVAYSAEAILTFRPMPLTKINGTPASMFNEMLNYARQSADDIVIHPGIVEDIPETFSDTLATSAYDHIRKLCGNAGMNFDVTAEIDGRGVLQLYANLYRRKGADTRLELNSDNTENSSPLLSEQGTIYNTIYGYSQASTKQSRYYALGHNQASVDKYGILAKGVVFSGITDQTALAAAAQNMADIEGEPRKMLRRVVLDNGKAFDNLTVGNTVTVKDTNAGFKAGGGYGFSTQARILSLDYNDLTNKAPLNIEVF